MGGELNWADIQPILARLGERLDYIEDHLVHMGNAVGYRYAPFGSEDAGLTEEVKELARAGRTLEAMKRYRELTGASAAQAKSAIGAL